MPPQEKPSPGRFHALLDRSAAAWLILAIGLIVTLALWQHFSAHFAERAADRFSHRAEAAKNLLLSRMQAHEQVLRGAAALFAASPWLGRALAARRKAATLGASVGRDTIVNPYRDIGRNDACPCGSGKKFKKCHGA